MNIKNNVSQSENKHHVTAIIVAAGNSTRMGSEQSKELIEILDKPVIAWTIGAFQDSDLIDDIVVVCRQEDLLNFYDITSYFEFDKVTTVVTGGASRHESVLKGIQSANQNTEFFAIHDGARPLILTDDINKVIKAAFAVKAATLGVPVKDTIKFTYPSGIIKSTPDRSNIWSVQTPQVFEKELYLNALKHASNLGREFTDDCQLIENTGNPVMMCEGDYTNIKITTPEDIYVAEDILKEREGYEDRAWI